MATYTGSDKRIAYLFEHGGGESSGSGVEGSHVYSLDEHVVGVWTDGKIVYEKAFDIGNLPNNTTKLVPHNISDIDKIISITGFCDNGNGLYFELSTVSSNYIAIYVHGANINIQTTSDRTAFSGFVVLQYTKSTDQGGHKISSLLQTYSLDEQVVGTWVDGKPLYEKSYAPIHLTGSQKLEVESFDQTQKYIVSINFVWSPGWNFGLGSQSLYHYWSIQNIGANGYNENTVVTSPQVYVQENKLYFHEKSNQGAGSSLYGTIQYTKATD